MAVETQPERAEPTGRGPAQPGRARSWWMRPGVHTGLIGAVAGYVLGHLLGNFLGGGYSRSTLSDSNDVPIVLGYSLAVIGWLAGVGVFNDLGYLVMGKPMPGRERSRRSRDRAGQVLPVHPRPQGRRHPVPVRHDRLLPDRRPVRDGDPERTAVAVVPSPGAQPVPDGRRRARHHDDDDDVLGHPRAVRAVLRPAADRVQAGGVPAARGARVLAHARRLRHPAVRPPVRRVPDRLDRVRAAGHPGRPRARTLTSSRSASWGSR